MPRRPARAHPGRGPRRSAVPRDPGLLRHREGDGEGGAGPVDSRRLGQDGAFRLLSASVERARLSVSVLLASCIRLLLLTSRRVYGYSSISDSAIQV